MTGAQTLAAFRRALVPALAVGLGVLALVTILLVSRPASYNARVGLVASPISSNQQVSTDYGAVVSLTMQALPELAVSDGTVTAIRAAVPDAPDATVLRDSITVELVPGSSVARISVIGSTQEEAAAVLQALVAQVQKANLLAPVAELKPIGSGAPTIQRVEGDPGLALGLGIVAGLVASLITVIGVQALRPRLLSVTDVEQVVEEVFAAGDEPPPVVALDDSEAGTNLLAAHLLAQKPVATEVSVVPAGPPLREDLAPRLRNALRNLRVARDAGLPVGQVLAATGSGSAADLDEWFGTADPRLDEPATVPGTADGTPPAPRRPGLFGPMASPGAGPDGDRRPGPVPPNPLGHLVVSVRLGGTTPTELTTALVAMRTHGTGVAGVAVG